MLVIDYAGRLAKIAYGHVGELRVEALAASFDVMTKRMDGDLKAEVYAGLIDYFVMSSQRQGERSDG